MQYQFHLFWSDQINLFAIFCNFHVLLSVVKCLEIWNWSWISCVKKIVSASNAYVAYLVPFCIVQLQLCLQHVFTTVAEALVENKKNYHGMHGWVTSAHHTRPLIQKLCIWIFSGLYCCRLSNSEESIFNETDAADDLWFWSVSSISRNCCISFQNEQSFLGRSIPPQTWGSCGFDKCQHFFTPTQPPHKTKEHPGKSKT